ncbi:hypothetical protein QN277_009580 [Acacia crassicarpa]|uniref:EF-hand domain-containing protein n=1 Tax=Acacia crassicarpa TaxID=499986 RepID=A0AAE1JMF2_9FABA|nr:hypothetical protein QN277_009580 [Acacia crassicarpa]
MTVFHPKGYTGYTKDQVINMLKEADVNDDGSLTKEELEKVLKKMGSNWAGYRAWRCMTNADKDRNGKIDLSTEMNSLIPYVMNWTREKNQSDLARIREEKDQEGELEVSTIDSNRSEDERNTGVPSRSSVFFFSVRVERELKQDVVTGSEKEEQLILGSWGLFFITIHRLLNLHSLMLQFAF